MTPRTRATSRASALAGALVTAALLAGLGVVAPPAALAHTETDVVAAPAGRSVTVSLRPTHGCDGSPTTAVTTRVPVEGATAGAVAGWTAEATDDGKGNTVVEWKGGSLPADQEGDFPVTFTVPDTPGELVLLPFIQDCANGEELSWIDGDPTGDYPAPRLLVLAAGAEPAASIDDLPADTPGRDQLTAIVDVDDPSATTAPATTAAPGSTTAPPTTAAGTTTSVVQTTRGAEPTGDGEDDDGLWPTVGVLAAIAVAASGALAVVLVRRRRRTA